MAIKKLQKLDKNQWIQRAKALFFDCLHDLEAESLKQEARDLIEQGGGFDYNTESSDTKLKWSKQKRRAIKRV